MDSLLSARAIRKVNNSDSKSETDFFINFPTIKVIKKKDTENSNPDISLILSFFTHKNPAKNKRVEIPEMILLSVKRPIIFFLIFIDFIISDSVCSILLFLFIASKMSSFFFDISALTSVE